MINHKSWQRRICKALFNTAHVSKSFFGLMFIPSIDIGHPLVTFRFNT